jgi:hypothetical protein
MVVSVVDVAAGGAASAARKYAGSVADAQEPGQPGVREPVAWSGIELREQACPVGVLGGDIGQHWCPPGVHSRERAGVAAGEGGQQRSGNVEFDDPASASPRWLAGRGKRPPSGRPPNTTRSSVSVTAKRHSAPRYCLATDRRAVSGST